MGGIGFRAGIYAAKRPGATRTNDQPGAAGTRASHPHTRATRFAAARNYLLIISLR